MPLPYKGKNVRIPELLKEIGFKEGFNPDGSMYFYQVGLRIDFVVPEKGRGFEKGIKINKLSLSAQSLRFLDMLFEYPREINIARGIKVKIPSPSSFLVHKLIVLQRRKNKADILKDMKQSICVAKGVIQDKEERKEIKKLYFSLSESWKKKVIKGINLIQKEFPLEMPVVKEIEKILKEKLEIRNLEKE
ncbi:MAG: GSU2403 family nucleotidyltransferase fold protein [bacterium]|nr:GSU2403 family nucleotidyltransferase fold protein [bacterium]